MKVGLLLDCPRSSKYVLDLVEWSKSVPNLEISHLIRAEPAPNGVGRLDRLRQLLRGKGLRHTVSHTLARLSLKLSATVERKLLARSAKDADHFDTFDISPLVPNEIHVAPIVSKSGLVHRFAAEDVDRIKSLNFDVLIRCGGAILRGEILNAARFGVWSFHHGDNRVNRGVPAGFWEVYHEEDATGFIIQRLTEELDGGDVLMRGHVQTQYHYLRNQAALYRKSNYYMKLLLIRLADGHPPKVLESFPYSNALFREPGAKEAIGYLARLVGRIVLNNWRKMRGVEFTWSVAFVHSNWRNSVLWRGIELNNPPGHFLADPFVICREGHQYCFVEDYDYASGRGTIAVYKLANDSGERIGTALAEAFHLSFPYVFEFDGDLYMCPETSEAGGIRIYKCTDFPLAWELDKVILPGISAVDTMIFEHEGKWWLFTNTDPAATGDYFELSLFCADSPRSDHWQPHADNPIRVDSRYARNAGLLKDGKRLFRISQRQGFDRYGKQADVHEIMELSKDSYVEKDGCAILPRFAEGIAGTHHMHCSGTTTVFDMVRLSKIGARAGGVRP